MKRFPILIFAALCAVACVKPGAQKPTGEPYVIRVSGITAPAAAKNVKASVEGYGTVAEAPVRDGGFELALPTTLPEKALFTVAEDERTKGATASDGQARLAFLTLELEGSVASISLDDSHLAQGALAITSRKALFIYADRPVTLTGESRWEQVAKSPLPDDDDQSGEGGEGGQTDEGEDHPEHRVEYTNSWVEITLAAGWNRVCSEGSVVLGADRYRITNTISHKPLDDCRWNVVNTVAGS
jgi:hypothetical protein